jgi:hypothetical protein
MFFRHGISWCSAIKVFITKLRCALLNGAKGGNMLQAGLGNQTLKKQAEPRPGNPSPRKNHQAKTWTSKSWKKNAKTWKRKSYYK